MTGIWQDFVGYFRGAITTLADVFSFLGNHRWAAAIVALTIVVRTLLLPLAIKQIRAMREMQRLQPEMQRLRQKFRNDRQRQMQEMQQLYQREGVNPYASCLPLVAQAPVMIAMFYALRDLDPVGGMPFLGIGDLMRPANASLGGWLLIVVMTLAQLISTRQLNPGQTEQQRRLQMLLPLVFVFIFMGFKAGLVLYWTTQALYQLVQQLIMTRDMRKPGGLWKALLPWGAPAKFQTPPKRQEVKAEVKAPVAARRDEAVAAPDPLAMRRDLEEKRRRRRRKKRKRRR